MHDQHSKYKLVIVRPLVALAVYTPLGYTITYIYCAIYILFTFFKVIIRLYGFSKVLRILMKDKKSQAN